MKPRNILFSFLFILIFKYARAPPLEAAEIVDTSWTEFWVVRLVVNLLGYASVVVPAYFVIQYLKKIKYNETGSGLCFPMVKACVFGAEVVESASTLPANEKKMGAKKRTFVLLFCAGGLQLAYLTWGVIQERIMTQEYGKTETSPGHKFTNSQFLVFVNRSLACLVAGCYILLFRQPRHNCPLYKFSFSSFSNIMSSWFQYEALKFVSFPTQVMGKACKVIPVMLMGKVVSGSTYQLYEWVTAGMLSLGISLFLLAQGGDKHVDVATGGIPMTTGSISGLVLMLGYMAFDSFTSNWQGKLFSVHKMSSVQMMFGVNLFSCVFTSCSLLEQGGFLEAFYFMAEHAEFLLHSVVLSVCSAVGQLFIFYTISEFGAVVFTIIMTMRQAFAILLSCLIYGHPVGLLGLVGILVVFSALFLRIYARSKVAKKATATGKV